MKNLFFSIIVVSVLIGCSVKQKRLVHFLSTLENVKTIISKEDSIKIDSVKQSLNEQAEKYKVKIEAAKEKGDLVLYCFEPKDNAEFRGGITLFREIIYKKFKVSTYSKEGENLIRVTVGENNNLEKIEFLKYSDESSKKQIEDIFKLKELDNWSSARLFRIPVKTQFEISVFIERR